MVVYLDYDTLYAILVVEIADLIFVSLTPSLSLLVHLIDLEVAVGVECYKQQCNAHNYPLNPALRLAWSGKCCCDEEQSGYKGVAYCMDSPECLHEVLLSQLVNPLNIGIIADT